ncbi:jupiter microtubule associated homolog 1-like isoform X1 [Carassius gibelio]|uniref:jupiter microtubule associated homolog 1-like isoform X1 n=1 Tax=Carassius gibelio TaxID=101364 RepID=UPI0022798E3D|nr:jupiter microtubule associated homolog 1-like isoform X1 [Carassius gibelio]
MTTTTNYQGMEPGAKNSSRVLCPPGGASNISFGTDDEKPVRKNKMASSIFAEPDDPHAHRRNNPPGGEASGILCGEPSAPLRRCQPVIVYDNGTPVERPANNTDQNEYEQENNEEAVEQKEEAAQPSAPSAANNPSGRRNPPGGKSSLILG